MQLGRVCVCVCVCVCVRVCVIYIDIYVYIHISCLGAQAHVRHVHLLTAAYVYT